jgi:hypothetical protein
MATAERRSVSMTALASVPRLNHGFPTLRRLGAISRRFTSGLSIFITASTWNIANFGSGCLGVLRAGRSPESSNGLSTSAT